MEDRELTTVAHMMHEVLADLGMDVDKKVLASRLKRMQAGLPREDEFAAICAWLGRCRLIHKLDQSQVPSESSDVYQVPDMLAVFETEGAGRLAFLLEVKSSNANTLSFTADYRDRMLAYSRLVGMPLLVAWKFQGMFWTLFEIEHMQLAKKNYNISYSRALSQSLLGVLAGDFAYVLEDKAGLHLTMKKEALISEERQDENTVHQEWRSRFTDVHFTDGAGHRVDDLSSDVQWIFQATNMEQHQEHRDDEIVLRYLPMENSMQFAHHSLVHLLNWALPAASEINWRKVALARDAVPTGAKFQSALAEAMGRNIVRYILRIRPQMHPSFLPVAAGDSE